MPNPLDRNALPDEDRMRTTTAWILQREPVLVRIAPAAVLLLVIGLAFWVATARVTVYDSVQAQVSDVQAGTQNDLLHVELDPERIASLTASSTVVLAPDAGRTRIDASVVHADPVSGHATLAVASPSPIGVGPVALRVDTGRRSLLSELVGTARAGGKRR